MRVKRLGLHDHLLHATLWWFRWRVIRHDTLHDQRHCSRSRRGEDGVCCAMVDALLQALRFRCCRSIQRPTPVTRPFSDFMGRVRIFLCFDKKSYHDSMQVCHRAAAAARECSHLTETPTIVAVVVVRHTEGDVTHVSPCETSLSLTPDTSHADVRPLLLTAAQTISFPCTSQ